MCMRYKGINVSRLWLNQLSTSGDVDSVFVNSRYNPPPVNRTLVGILCGLAAAAIWGGMYVVSKVVLEIIPPFALVSIRLLLGVLTLPIVLLVRGFPNIPRKQVWQVLGVGFVGYGISLSLQFLGTKLSTAANGSLVTSATPAFVLLFAWLLLRERSQLCD